MAKLTNGRVVVEVPDERAEHFCIMMGYRVVQESQPEKAEAPSPTPKRGRPKKVVTT